MNKPKKVSLHEEPNVKSFYPGSSPSSLRKVEGRDDGLLKNNGGIVQPENEEEIDMQNLYDDEGNDEMFRDEEGKKEERERKSNEKNDEKDEDIGEFKPEPLVEDLTTNIPPSMKHDENTDHNLKEAPQDPYFGYPNPDTLLSKLWGNMSDLGEQEMAKRTLDSVSTFFLGDYKSKEDQDDPVDDRYYAETEADDDDKSYEEESDRDNYVGIQHKGSKPVYSQSIEESDEYSYYVGEQNSDDGEAKLNRTSLVSDSTGITLAEENLVFNTFEEPEENMLKKLEQREQRLEHNPVEYPGPIVFEEAQQAPEDKISRQLATLTVLYANVVRAIRDHKWVTVMEFVSSNPDLVLFSSPNKKQNIVHILARQKATVPESTMSKIITMRPKAAGCSDDRGCLPLHYAAAFGNKPQIIKILLNAYPQGAMTRNLQGNYPLHLAAALGDYGKDSFFLLLQAYPHAIKGSNQNLQTPLHLACSKGGQAKIIVQRLLNLSRQYGYDVLTNDIDGQNPLHLAIRSRAPFDVVESFYLCDALRAFVQTNSAGDLPIHSSLSLPDIDPTIVKIVLKAAEFTGGVQGGSQLVPIQLAMKRGMPDEIIKLLLLSDFPFDSSTIGEELPQLKPVEHGHSWWHILCSHVEYLVIVEEILRGVSQAHIIFLKYMTGPDGSTILNDAVNREVQFMFHRLLQFHGRYELIATIDPILASRSRVFHVVDYGSESAFLEQSQKQNVELDNSTENELNNDNIDVDNGSKRKVELHVFHNASAFYSEAKVREWYNLDPAYVVDILESHCEENYDDGQKPFYCISYEKEDYVLQDFYIECRSKNSAEAWVKRSIKILRDIAVSIQHLHEQGCVHGYITPLSVGKYGSQWKLKDIGMATHMGRFMSGPLRSCAPPEYFRLVSGHKSDNNMPVEPPAEDNIKKVELQTLKKTTVRTRKGIITPEKRRSTFGKKQFMSNDSKNSDDNTLGRRFFSKKNSGYSLFNTDEMGVSSAASTKEEQHEKHTTDNSNEDEENEKDTTSIRNLCIACPSWDVWSFGLIVTYLFLGPNNLIDYSDFTSSYEHREDVWKVLEHEVGKMAGQDAGNLVKYLLHPDKDDRFQYMNYILDHPFFGDLPKYRVRRENIDNEVER
eukprot:CAMPEP_0113306578 /NCGR_PEP_ID=MMETSP0010_2-20120614/5772_1 /TAXON_ID=216773 ORGANISM="Corethron hystrix, Strain 308" /NCGR_SAMPLE_ID=MMETSP0010_2 /ASSEMBLY_ACC=CAM_ASM_000155 /LENGTH=1123 /DNA_ID=CAMNT_0000161271 /DNA_START=281 /DNA_END=3652 /DNA_ORIENTATION=- /assembly_acc=CAM_ASM_000155